MITIAWEPMITIAALSIALGAAAAGACFPSEAGLDEYRSEWYCKHLAAAGAGQLQGEHAYRFIYLPSFHAPRVVTVVIDGGTPVVEGVVLSGKGGYEPGAVEHRTTRALDAKEWRLLLARLENAGMWQPTDPQDESGHDGSQWILEGRSGDWYRLHDVWSPKPSAFPQYHKVCAYLLELARIRPPHGELY
jgi:hypothetical protein